jgi:ATP-dependent DNA ligase
MYGYIDGYDFGEMEAMKYYAPPASWSEQKKKDHAHNAIFGGDWYGAEKKDGYFAKLIKDEDGNIILYSRSRGVNGKFADKHEWVPHLNSFFETLPQGTCLLGELYFPSKPGSKNVTTIMGCLKERAIERQKAGEKLHFYVFDILAWEGKSNLAMSFEDRVDELNLMWRAGYENEYVSIAKYFTGKELWAMLQEILARGDEGIVITHKDGKYEPGKRPSKTTLKIKKELKQTIDCFFTGRGSAPTHEYTGKEIETWQYWEHVTTHEKLNGEFYRDYQMGKPIMPVTKGWYNGWYGSLEIAVLRKKAGSHCKINGEIIEDYEIYPIGWLSGLPDEMKADPSKFAFKPIEVTAMEYDAICHTLRHGKMVGWRNDLTVKDCTLDKI